MTWLAIKLFMGKALERLLGLFRWLLAHPKDAALIGLVCLSVWLWRADSRHIAERDAARARIAALIKASDEAKAAQVAVNQAPAIAAKTIAEKSNAEAPAYYRRVADAANANRVRAASCPSGVANLPGADPAATVNDGPAGITEMVSRSREDDDLIVAAAARAAKMHDDARQLIEAGVAVAGD